MVGWLADLWSGAQRCGRWTRGPFGAGYKRGLDEKGGQSRPIGGRVRSIVQTVSTELFDQFTERFECWNRGELDLMQAMYAEDGVFDVSAVFADVEPQRGHEAMRRHWDEVWEVWRGLRLDPQEAFDVGDRRYVVEVRLWGKGKQSGVEVDQRFAFLYTLRSEDDRIIRAQLFPDVAAAMSVAEASAAAPD